MVPGETRIGYRIVVLTMGGYFSILFSLFLAIPYYSYYLFSRTECLIKADQEIRRMTGKKVVPSVSPALTCPFGGMFF
jgi:hypothetical protein